MGSETNKLSISSGVQFLHSDIFIKHGDVRLRHRHATLSLLIRNFFECQRASVPLNLHCQINISTGTNGAQTSQLCFDSKYLASVARYWAAHVHTHNVLKTREKLSENIRGRYIIHVKRPNLYSSLLLLWKNVANQKQRFCNNVGKITSLIYFKIFKLQSIIFKLEIGKMEKVR